MKIGGKAFLQASLLPAFVHFAEVTYLLFTGDIFLSGIAVQEASGVRPMWKVEEKHSYKQA